MGAPRFCVHIMVENDICTARTIVRILQRRKTTVIIHHKSFVILHIIVHLLLSQAGNFVLVPRRAADVSGQRNALQMLVEEIQQMLVSLLICLFDVVLLEVTSCGHETMNLILEPLDLMRNLQVLFILVNGFLVFVLGWNHHHGDRDIRGVVRVDHGGVAGRSGLERCAGAGREVDNLRLTVSAQSELCKRKDLPCRPSNILRHPNT